MKCNRTVCIQNHLLWAAALGKRHSSVSGFKVTKYIYSRYSTLLECFQFILPYYILEGHPAKDHLRSLQLHLRELGGRLAAFLGCGSPFMGITPSSSCPLSPWGKTGGSRSWTKVPHELIWCTMSCLAYWSSLSGGKVESPDCLKCSEKEILEHILQLLLKFFWAEPVNLAPWPAPRWSPL